VTRAAQLGFFRHRFIRRPRASQCEHNDGSDRHQSNPGTRASSFHDSFTWLMITEPYPFFVRTSAGAKWAALDSPQCEKYEVRTTYLAEESA
jgi:hypothetical protein